MNNQANENVICPTIVCRELEMVRILKKELPYLGKTMYFTINAEKLTLG